jgi:hypothetical protein
MPYLRPCSSISPSLCNLLWVTKPIFGLSLNLEYKLLTKNFQTSVSFLKIGPVTDMNYFRMLVSFCLYFPYLLTDFDEIQCRRSSLPTIEQCYENKCSERCTLSHGIRWILLSIFFIRFWLTFDTGDIHDNLFSCYEFYENQCSEIHTSHMVVSEVGFYFPHLLSNSSENWYKIFFQKKQ